MSSSVKHMCSLPGATAPMLKVSLISVLNAYNVMVCWSCIGPLANHVFSIFKELGRQGGKHFQWVTWFKKRALIYIVYSSYYDTNKWPVYSNLPNGFSLAFFSSSNMGVLQHSICSDIVPRCRSLSSRSEWGAGAASTDPGRAAHGAGCHAGRHRGPHQVGEPDEQLTTTLTWKYTSQVSLSFVFLLELEL